MKLWSSISFGVSLCLLSGAATAYTRPYAVSLCWEETSGVCQGGYSDWYYYDDEEIVYMTTYDGSGYDIDYYYITGYHADVEKVTAIFDIDTATYEVGQFYIWYPYPGSTWVYGNDYQDTSGSSVGFSEWQSSGDSIPYDWDYDSASYLVRAWFQATDPYDDDLYIIIYDGYLSE